jgi:hypothetical protein
MTHKQDGCIYVLWHIHYNEVMAAIFLVHLRNAGLCARLVGLRGDRQPGRYGVTLAADISLGEVLRLHTPILGIVAPCAPGAFDSSEPDPRVGELLARAQAQQAVFVVEDDHAAPQFPWPASTLAVSPETVSVLAAAQALVAHLCAHSAAPPQVAGALP